jgi:hypothetical protein
VTLYNIARFATTLDNVGQVVVAGSKFIAPVTAGVNTDGIHVDGPSEDVSISDDYFNTRDDAIALNAIEGYCGPITRVQITNSSAYNAREMLRAYNQGVNCGNGLNPLVSQVSVSNYNGSATLAIAALGFASTGTQIGITDFKWANSTVEMVTSGGGAAFDVTNNLGRIDLDGMTFKGVSCLFCSDTDAETISLLKLHNVSLVGTSYFSGFPNVLGVLAGGGGLTATDIIVDGLGYFNDPSGTMTANCPFCGSGSVTNLYASNIDMALISSFADSHATNINGQAGGWRYSGDNYIRNSGQTVDYEQNGIDFWPLRTSGGGYSGFRDNSSNHYCFFCTDNNNDYVTIGGLCSTSSCGTVNGEPVFIGSGAVNFNRRLGNNGPIYGNVGNITVYHSPSGTASLDLLHFAIQAYGAGGPSDALTLGADLSAKTHNNTLDDGIGNENQPSGTVHSWNSDTAFSRDSAGVLDVGNGTAGNKSGTVNLATLNAINGHITSTGTDAPTISSCGGGTLISGGTDNAFRITGISTATSCTATFSANIKGVCVAGGFGSGGTGILIGTVPNSASVTFNITTLTTDINAICF